MFGYFTIYCNIHTQMLHFATLHVSYYGIVHIMANDMCLMVYVVNVTQLI